MNRRAWAVLSSLLAGTASVVLSTSSTALAGTSGDTDGRLKALEQELDDVHAQLADLKRSQSDQYGDVNRQLTGLVQVKLDNGRPTFTTSDGNFSLAIRALAQLDWGYYSQSAAAAALPA